jgi:hypothetical protein
MLDIEETIIIAIVIAVVGIYGSAAYSAFMIRRRLSGELYRRQSFGIGLVAVLFGMFAILLTLGSFLYILFFILLWIIFWGILYWIDSSIRAARFTDPLFRDTFSWTRLRVLLWIYSVGGPLIVVAIFLVSAGLLPAGFNFILANETVFFALALAPAFVTFFSGFVVFPIEAMRSGDKFLKRHFEWFAIYVSVLFVLFLFSGTTTETPFDLVQGVVLAPAGYLLYRSARSLVPIYSFKAESGEKPQVKPI